MSLPLPQDHWSAHFPELRAQADGALLDAIRLFAAQAPDAPLSHMLDLAARALGRPLDLGTPGTVARSFDERWLLALFAALRDVDLSRYQFLLRSRLKAGDAARLHFALTQAQVWIEARL